MKERILVLKSDLLNDINKIEKIFDRFHRAYDSFLNANEYSRLVESAFYVNQIYSGFERILKNVDVIFENSIVDLDWHKSLLEKMALNIEGIRPSVISKKTSSLLNELRGFRHFFRHAYDVDIDKRKFGIVADSIIELENLYKSDFEKFIQFLDKLIEE